MKKDLCSFLMLLAMFSSQLMSIDFKLAGNINTGFSEDFSSIYEKSSKGFDLTVFPINVNQKIKLGLQFGNYKKGGELPISGKPSNLSFNHYSVVAKITLVSMEKTSGYVESQLGSARIKEANYLGEGSKNALLVSFGTGFNQLIWASEKVATYAGVGLNYIMCRVGMITSEEKKNMDHLKFGIFLLLSLR